MIRVLLAVLLLGMLALLAFMAWRFVAGLSRVELATMATIAVLGAVAVGGMVAGGGKEKE